MGNAKWIATGLVTLSTALATAECFYQVEAICCATYIHPCTLPGDPPFKWTCEWKSSEPDGFTIQLVQTSPPHPQSIGEKSYGFDQWVGSCTRDVLNCGVAPGECVYSRVDTIFCSDTIATGGMCFEE